MIGACFSSFLLCSSNRVLLSSDAIVLADALPVNVSEAIDGAMALLKKTGDSPGTGTRFDKGVDATGVAARGVV